MELAAGTPLGAYTIVGRLGAGGMGVVYRARDPKLERDVAIKVLPVDFADRFADKDERLARFEREARSLAALQHPNVATIFGFEESGETHFLVMELAEGQNLAQLLKSGPLPLEEAVPLFGQIAEGLEAAHEKGIVHRDLKPANIMVAKDGHAKILDFGLAKALDEPSPDSELSQSPTMTAGATLRGQILGTAAYMSPEQAKGDSVDRRTDLWSFGVVLWEALSGRNPFAAPSVSETLAAVLREDPDPADLPEATPESVRRVLERCLTRNPKQRLADLSSVRLDLGAAFGEGASTSRVESSTERRSWSWGPLATGLAAGALLFWLLDRSQTPERDEPRRARLEVAIPAAAGGTFGVNAGPPALSPNGRFLAFVERSTEGELGLWIRDLSDGSVRKVTDARRPSLPFWSPDSQRVGFYDLERLYTVDRSGGRSRLVMPEGFNFFSAPSWSADGVILLDQDGRLHRTLDQEGTVELLWAEEPDPPFRGAVHTLPDDTHFFYSQSSWLGDTDSGVYVGSRDGSVRKRILEEPSNVVFIDASPGSPRGVGTLLFWQDGALRSQSFDRVHLELVGDSQLLLDSVPSRTFGFASFSATSDRLVVERAAASGSTELVWLDRSGRELEKLGPVAEYFNPMLSRDKSRLAYDSTVGNGDLWVRTLDGSPPRRVTFHPRDETGPVWSRDDGRIYFFAWSDLMSIEPSGEGRKVLLKAGSGINFFPLDESPEGRYLMFGSSEEDGGDLWLFDHTTGEAREWLAASNLQDGARFSPDGRWVVYASAEGGSGRDIYVRSFPEGKGETRVTEEGGENPSWSSDGSEVFYVSADGYLMTMEVEWPGGSESEAPLFQQPKRLFRASLRTWAELHHYDVSADSQSFLVNRLIRGSSTLTLIENWNQTADE